MEVMITLQIQTSIAAEDEDSYEEKRDGLIERLEDMGFSVDIQDESGEDIDDYIEDFDEEGDYDEEDPDEDEEENW